MRTRLASASDECQLTVADDATSDCLRRRTSSTRHENAMRRTSGAEPEGLAAAAAACEARARDSSPEDGRPAPSAARGERSGRHDAATCESCKLVAVAERASRAEATGPIREVFLTRMPWRSRPQRRLWPGTYSRASLLIEAHPREACGVHGRHQTRGSPPASNARLGQLFVVFCGLSEQPREQTRLTPQLYRFMMEL